MPRRSPRSARQSTTSQRSSKRPGTSRPLDTSTSLAELIAALPPDRAAAAFTHSSWAAERNESYERLEFLGDSVLELAIAHTLYQRFPEYDEGQLAKIRSHVVSRASCALVSVELGLGQRLIAQETGPAGERAKLADNRNVLAAVLEAVLAALYLEHGFEAIACAIVGAFESRIQFTLTNQIDHKTELQETVAREGRSLTYVLIGAEGPPHQRTFTTAAVIDGDEVGIGQGKSKKDAEQQAARQALERFAGQPR